ncbi:hypothetical protein CONCODRAFT_72205 [Conidiobolus coronatus NRRL 28638]|uniref:BD-FAE-like domain-containing protein n=1 Tax=Conidiobolus coronatus (strain ATCC 28846 / CBS 209.66 / NRRL 28638) TaxID=796925 RepID=A0A137P0F4_CONC2|nr:hypothetical protein CONCODRAFT_72205 [Conidiobolus coronatus NRRL 28638]|eukprot:KXN68507.1 hypothetical protein CONCODRAFT_72205 [Conidiobolus coronatus NRRL 28638]
MATKVASYGRAAVMVINHHMSPPARNPTFIEDVAKAIIYAASNPDKLSYDSEKLILMCHGTGCLMSETILLNPTKVAPMAAFINSIGFTDKIKGAIGVEGVYDLPKHALTVSMTDLETIKVAMGRARKDWVESSPALNPPDSTWTGKTLPKHYLIQSRTDELVDPIQTVNFFNHIINNSGYASIKPNLPGSHYLVLETDDFAKYISDVVGKVTIFADTSKNPQVLPMKAPNQPQQQPQSQPIHINHHP